MTEPVSLAVAASRDMTDHSVDLRDEAVFRAALLAELRSITDSLHGLRAEIRTAASAVAAGQLIAVDASRSEVYATLLDDQLVETATRIAALLSNAKD